MQHTLTLPLESPSSATSAAWAHRLLSLVCILVTLTVVIGQLWDGYWHITYAFDSFWSPPHVFVYSMSTFCATLASVLVFVPRLRRCFGPGFRVPLLPFAVPGPLFLLCGGFVALGVAGILLDNLWHTTFGLDETAWSLPHAMIGGSLAVVGCGYISARLALRSQRPLRWYTLLWMTLLLIGLTKGFLGPLYEHNTRDSVQALANIPTLAAQQGWQRVFQIYTEWNLTRSNLAFPVLGALWAGAALVLVRRLEPRTWRFLALVLVWWLLALDGGRSSARWLDQWLPMYHDSVNWLPPPLLLTAIIFSLARWRGLNEQWAFAVAGFAFGAQSCFIWGAQPWGALALAAAAAAVLGAWLGARMFHALTHPTELAVKCLAFVFAIGIPLGTGAVDLWLRMATR
jgi:hypothetical protein